MQTHHQSFTHHDISQLAPLSTRPVPLAPHSLEPFPPFFQSSHRRGFLLVHGLYHTQQRPHRRLAPSLDLGFHRPGLVLQTVDGEVGDLFGRGMRGQAGFEQERDLAQWSVVI